MSIQPIHKSLFNYKLRDGIGLFRQMVYREINVEKPRVFFRYSTSLTHPSFDRFAASGPVLWSNYHKADMAHWINYPAIVTKIPFLLECNDHPLSALGYRARGLYEPGEILPRLADVAEIYNLPQCKAIGLYCEGYKNLFEYYFDKTLNNKFIELHCPGTVAKVESVKEGEGANFVCLASDYELKGVDLLIEAWLAIEDRRGARLVIACPNVPAAAIERSGSEIIFVHKAPLTNLEKHELLSANNVSLGPMHVHGGANLSEGMEYGHAIIYFATHSTFFRGLGEEIPVPYYFYLPSHYGVQWKTFEGFKGRLRDDKRSGKFSDTVQQLSSAIKRYITSPEILFDDRKKVLHAANGPASLAARNIKLRQIYSVILDQNS